MKVEKDKDRDNEVEMLIVEVLFSPTRTFYFRFRFKNVVPCDVIEDTNSVVIIACKFSFVMTSNLFAKVGNAMKKHCVKCFLLVYRQYIFPFKKWQRAKNL